MPPTCNIDRRGRRFRAYLGIALLALGTTSTGLWFLPLVARWTVAGLLFAAGLFTCYEAWAGWCAVRALGYKTRI